MNVLPIPYLSAGSAPVFPDPAQAMDAPNGLLALGGDLSVPRLLAAYGNGIFPWFGEDEPILWWSPDPRCVFDTGAIHISRSLRRHLRRCDWELRIDTAFEQVLDACAAPREGQHGTWIVPAMRQAYLELHQCGHAHSIEAWDGNTLVGGLYGVGVGRLFCGESMFSARSGGSKTVLVALCQRLHAAGCPWLDAQVTNPHLTSMGAIDIDRTRFLADVARLSVQSTPDGLWTPGALGKVRERV
ncbi:leucyl/phenylalanyl-tRNA--protein transferase [Oleiagrimonas sp. C23AA]|uniref:leucyl/phenylalanyl-tRNA--protein transferase n=1 Tax=Oleiagrimonas sp. C23AA TaxID=2719047 RepID=UPI00141FE20C|nr:leucyl/phenylalanyl-tRNA--protein transferase [Oleiagrimonas sp. C23AA]NII10542.1 leucyl/phenylalanyl-tRNA--protein transferase [Oleiagrimonas sp. C23AA]